MAVRTPHTFGTFWKDIVKTKKEKRVRIGMYHDRSSFLLKFLLKSDQNKIKDLGSPKIFPKKWLTNFFKDLDESHWSVPCRIKLLTKFLLKFEGKEKHKVRIGMCHVEPIITK